MVRALHAAGIEVILDVVYNHTGRGQPLGPDALAARASTTPSTTACRRQDPRYYIDFTGCGNTLNMQHPRVLQLIMDSLRYWVTEMHVDGFRFDLASTLARELYEVDKLGAFFDIIHQDPVLSQVKLIAEPGTWRAATRSATFPSWLGGVERQVPRQRAPVLKGDGGMVSELATRLTGSQRPVRAERPAALRQHQLRHLPRRLHPERLVTYNEKHNDANGEDNHDGTNDNDSWNCGVEGPTDDPAHPSACASGRSATCIATLLLSQGVPMLSAATRSAGPSRATTTPTARTTS